MHHAREPHNLQLAALYLKYAEEAHVLHVCGLRIVAYGMINGLRKVSVSKLGDDIELMIMTVGPFTPTLDIERDLTRVIEEM